MRCEGKVSLIKEHSHPAIVSTKFSFICLRCAYHKSKCRAISAVASCSHAPFTAPKPSRPILFRDAAILPIILDWLRTPDDLRSATRGTLLYHRLACNVLLRAYRDCKVRTSVPSCQDYHTSINLVHTHTNTGMAFGIHTSLHG